MGHRAGCALLCIQGKIVGEVRGGLRLLGFSSIKKKFRVFCWKIVYAIGQSNDKGVKRYVYSGDVSDEGFLYGEDVGL